MIRLHDVDHVFQILTFLIVACKKVWFITIIKMVDQPQIFLLVDMKCG